MEAKHQKLKQLVEFVPAQTVGGGREGEEGEREGEKERGEEGERGGERGETTVEEREELNRCEL